MNPPKWFADLVDIIAIRECSILFIIYKNQWIADIPQILYDKNSYKILQCEHTMRCP